MVKVKLRSKGLSNGRQSLYLDFYPPIFNPVTGKESRREFLYLFTFDKPETREQETHNKNILLKANSILLTKVHLLEQGKYEFATNTPVSVSFDVDEQRNKDKDFLIDLLQKVRTIEKQVLEYLKQ